MGKIKALVIFAIILVVSLVLGFFQIQNDHDIVVDLLYMNEPVETSVGRFAMGFFFAGTIVGVGLCLAISLLMGIELKSLRRKNRKLNNQLEKMRERSAKDSG